LRSLSLIVLAAAVLAIGAPPVQAQDTPPKIGPFVIDIQGTFPGFPRNQQLADSRGLSDVRELPGRGLGLHGGAHVYPFKWKAVTFGVGADVAIARAHQAGPQYSEDAFGRAATERFRQISPELSFNFGDGDGWSYISGGVGFANWSIVPEGEVAFGPDTERLRTVNYGGGARWFIKRHLAFSFDVRFYQIDPSTPVLDRPNGPRTTLLIMGAGISVK
jgi:hypothetical protein